MSLAVTSVGEWAAAIAVIIGALTAAVASLAQLKQGRVVKAKVEAVTGSTEALSDKVDEVKEAVK